MSYPYDQLQEARSEGMSIGAVETRASIVAWLRRAARHESEGLRHAKADALDSLADSIEHGDDLSPMP